MATSIGEEGLDFPACSVVIRYDRSGRATAPGAVRPPGGIASESSLPVICGGPVGQRRCPVILR